MTVALDTDVLVHGVMGGTDRHHVVRAWLSGQVEGGEAIALAPRVILEFLHVSTDPRRFERPLAMPDAIDRVRRLWDARDTVRLVPSSTDVPRTFDLMDAHRLGRKHILDTALVATLESAGVRRLATFNEIHYRVFRQIEIVVPGAV